MIDLIDQLTALKCRCYLNELGTINILMFVVVW